MNAGPDSPHDRAPDPEPGDITRLLNAHDGEHPDALAALAPLVYDELRGIARRQLRSEAAGHTLQTTDLVHEAFLKLVRAEEISFSGRAHFFALSARVMRQILIDWAKRRRAGKRGGGAEVLSLDDALDAAPAAFGEQGVTDLITLDRALERLERIDVRQARVVEYRFFAGMSVEETAEALQVSRATVKRDWSVARAWLNHALGGGGDPESGEPGDGAEGDL